MAQAGYTPISLYYSTTAAAVPLAANLAAGELAINIVDGKLYYENNSGVVTLLASAAGASGDVVGPASATDNAVARFDGTTGKLIQNGVVIIGDTGAVTGVTDLTASGSVTLSGGTANGVTYLNGSKVLTSGSALTYNGTNVFTFIHSSDAYLYVASSGNASGNLSLRGAGANASYGAINNYRTDNSTQNWQIGGVVDQGVLPFFAGSTEGMRLTSTGLGIGTTSPAAKLQVNGLAFIYNEGSSTSRFLMRNTTTGSSGGGFDVNQVGVDTTVFNSSNGYLSFGTNNTERARITAAGYLIVGATSAYGSGPIQGFSASASNFSTSQFSAIDTTTSTTGVGGQIGFYGRYNSGSTDSAFFGGIQGIKENSTNDNTACALTFYTRPTGTAPSEKMRLDSSGNLGLGVTPSAWGSSKRALQVGNSTAIWQDGGGAGSIGYVSHNVYDDGTTEKYIFADEAEKYYQAAGQHRWYTAASGTAGNAITFTQAMTLDASGNLGLGTTSPNFESGTGKGLQVNYSGGLGSHIKLTDSASGSGATDGFDLYAYNTNGYVENYEAGAIVFRNNGSERARIDSSGRLLVGQTAIVLNNNNRAEFTGACGIGVVSTGGAAFSGIQSWNQAGTGDNVFAEFFNDAGGTLRGSITYNRAGGLTVYNTTSDYRAKDIIGPVNNSGELIDSVPVYMGKMKDATQERPMFIAHETPAYAHTGEKDEVDADGNPVYQKMDASTLIPVMWAEIQSLRKRLADAGI